MVSSKSSISIKNRLKDVYDIATTYPRFVRFFNKKVVLISTESFLSVKVGMKRFGINFEWSGEGLKIPNQTISFVQTQGLLKGLKAVWEFKSVDEYTTSVNIKTDFQVKIPLIGNPVERILSYYLVENTTRNILAELKIASEENMVLA